MFVQKDAAVNQTFEQLFSDNYDGKLFLLTFGFLCSKCHQQLGLREDRWKDCRDCGLLRCGYGSGDCECIVFFRTAGAARFEENTTDGTFHGAKQDENAEFMNQKLSDGIYYEDETMQAIVLWTTSGGQMVLCLPKDG